MELFFLFLCSIGIGLMFYSKLKEGLDKNPKTTSEQIDRLESKVDEILVKINELKEQKAKEELSQEKG